jgi:hypothetical protein
MTVEERAKEVVLKCISEEGNWAHPSNVAVVVAEAIRKAVDEERQRVLARRAEKTV